MFVFIRRDIFDLNRTRVPGYLIENYAESGSIVVDSNLLGQSGIALLENLVISISGFAYGSFWFLQKLVSFKIFLGESKTSSPDRAHVS